MRKPTKLLKVLYTVRGKGVFPFDMLRYDHSHPAAKEDIIWIGPGLDESDPDPTYRRDERELMLVAYFSIPQRGFVRDHFPTKLRWASFLWSVTEVYPVELVDFKSVPKEHLPKDLR